MKKKLFCTVLYIVNRHKTHCKYILREPVIFLYNEFLWCMKYRRKWYKSMVLKYVLGISLTCLEK